MSDLEYKASFKELEISLMGNIFRDAKAVQDLNFSQIYENIDANPNYIGEFEDGDIEVELIDRKIIKKKRTFYVFCFRITHYGAKDSAMKSRNKSVPNSPSRKTKDNGVSSISHLIIEENNETFYTDQVLRDETISRAYKVYKALHENTRWFPVQMLNDFFKDYTEIAHLDEDGAEVAAKASCKGSLRPSKSFADVLKKKRFNADGEEKKILFEVEVVKPVPSAAQTSYRKSVTETYKFDKVVDPWAMAKKIFGASKDEGFTEIRMKAFDTDKEGLVTYSRPISQKSFQQVVEGYFAENVIVDLEKPVRVEKDKIDDGVVKAALKAHWGQM